MEARCGDLAVAAGARVRRPLQPRDTNVAASTVVVGKAAPKPKAHPKGATRPALPSLPPAPLFPVVKPTPPVKDQCDASVAGVAEVSLAEELERARERRARLRAAREQTEREMVSRAETMERATAEWERRAEDQRRLVSELMRLIGVPEVYTPVESLRSKEERKRRVATIGRSGSTGSISTASTVQADVGAKACSDQQSEDTGGIIETAKATEITS